MPLPTSNSPLLRAIDPQIARNPSDAAIWEKALSSVVSGGAGLTRNLVNPVIRFTDPRPTISPPVPANLKPSSNDLFWEIISKALSRSSPQNEQLIRERLPAEKPKTTQSLFQNQDVLTRLINGEARKIATMASGVQTRINPHVAPVTKPIVFSMENMPQLLLSGPSGKMKAANLIVGSALDYGAHSSASGAGSKLLTPGNSLPSNIAQSILTPTLQYLGF